MLETTIDNFWKKLENFHVRNNHVNVKEQNTVKILLIKETFKLKHGYCPCIVKKNADGSDPTRSYLPFQREPQTTVPLED